MCSDWHESGDDGHQMSHQIHQQQHHHLHPHPHHHLHPHHHHIHHQQHSVHPHQHPHHHQTRSAMLQAMSYSDGHDGSAGSGSGSTGSSNGNKSTKGASKMRRDLINSEIANLRDLLPLPSSTRQRLSQLQLMALVLVYVRKSNYFDQVFKMIGREQLRLETPCLGFSKALNGFLMMATQTGKLLYISDNAAEYLGHSMEDLLIHGDSVYDIIDKQDHASIQSELMRGLHDEALSPDVPPSSTSSSASSLSNHDKRIFLCRMNVSRNARRQMRFGDQKVVLIEGRFSGVLPLCSRSEPVFLSWCTPIAMPETRECVVQGATNIFTSIHSMDLKVTSIDANGEFYLGYKKFDLQGVSWYNLLHPDCIKDVQSKHRLITQSENDRSCILLLRLQRQDGNWIWAHTVLQVKDNLDSSQSPVIVCTNQVLSDREAKVMKANSWLYHYYMVQSRLQYSLAYGGQSPSSLAAAFYSPMTGSGHAFAGHGSLDAQHVIHPHSAFLPTAGQGPAIPAHHPAYSGYSYTPPAGAYHLQHHQESQGLHSSLNANHVIRSRSSESPLDFSSATNGASYGHQWQPDEVSGPMMLRADHIASKQFSINQARNSASSPDYRSESSSGSPMQMALLDASGVDNHQGSGSEVAALMARYHSAANNVSSKYKSAAAPPDSYSGISHHQDINDNIKTLTNLTPVMKPESAQQVPESHGVAVLSHQPGGHQHQVQQLKTWNEEAMLSDQDLKHPLAHPSAAFSGHVGINDNAHVTSAPCSASSPSTSSSSSSLNDTNNNLHHFR